MSLITFNIGGVPEHFNLPIHLAVESGEFEKAGIHVNWTDHSGGTGQMIQALRKGEVDICILLTEGIITDILNGNPSKIVSGYVNSPLTWGIHTNYDSRIDSLENQFGQKIAISRYGSGSHLMPIVNALIQEKKIKGSQFVVVNNLDGGLKSLQSGEASIFYWEKYTTKPYVDNGILKRIGEFNSPWPCFMIAAREEVITKHPKQLDRLLKLIHASCRTFMENDESPTLVSERYGLKLKSAQYWFHGTEWATNSWVSDKMLKSVVFALKEAGIVKHDTNLDSLVWKRG
ncbi:MAG: substrate-binding domain-containing protein [Bacteroidota bacterium]